MRFGRYLGVGCFAASFGLALGHVWWVPPTRAQCEERLVVAAVYTKRFDESCGTGYVRQHSVQPHAERGRWVTLVCGCERPGAERIVDHEQPDASL